jgi:hypothetical protein
VDSPSLLSPWTFDPLQVVPTVIVAVLYFRRTQTLAARGQPVSRWKQASFWTGIALVIFALDSPVDALGEEHFFFIHMLQHVVIGDLRRSASWPNLGPDPAAGAEAARRRTPADLIRSSLPGLGLNLYIWHIRFSTTVRCTTPVTRSSTSCSSRAGA